MTKHPLRQLMLLLFFFLLIKPLWAGDMNRLGFEKMIHMDVQKVGCNVEVYVNGIPTRHSILKQPFSSLPVHPFLIDGENEIEVVVNSGLTPTQSRQGSKEMDTTEMEVKAQLVKYPPNVIPGEGEGEILANLAWKGQANTKIAFPKVISTKVNLGKVFGEWGWQKAEKINLNPVEIQGIVAYLKVFHEALSNGDGKKVLELVKLRFDENGRAFPTVDRKKEELEFVSNIENFKKKYPDWKMLPLDPEFFDFRVVAGGRMVEIINKDWQPTIRGTYTFHGKKEEYPYRLFLSKIKGKWVVVR